MSGGTISSRARGEVRTDCLAKISIVKQQTGPDWSVSVFVEDPKSRPAYSVFGDVVVLDSTYNTNNNEKTESYIWLLDKFIEAMPTGAPKAIITDQDPALAKALARVLPETVHRYCLWHILNKFPDKISPVTLRDHYQNDENADDDPAKFLMSRRSKLSYKASILIDDASLTDERTKFLDEQLDYIHGKIEEMSISPTTKYCTQRRKNLDKSINIGDPSQIRTKGCGKRMLSSKEKSTVKPRACRGCGLRRVSHDKRNCPDLYDGYILELSNKKEKTGSVMQVKGEDLALREKI
ncbi:hypothetical protein AAHA92_24934 [Salvia divinorum]|uniref:MULE transposase domain-containing protein n=1 Tax=Salvia divinorum TaxID=28513 RepID=A0ABD1G910_SALDI